jgi:O-antigen ligase
MAGFFIAASLVIMISAGKRTAFGMLIAGAVLTPVFWTTGIHNDFLDACIFRRSPVETRNTPLETLNPSVGETLIETPPPSLSVGETLIETPPPSLSKGPGLLPLAENEEDSVDVSILGVGTVPKEFFNFSGRTQVWKKGLGLTMDSPILGYGFQADRYLLNTHAHNSVVQSLLQTGILGTVPFIAGLLLAWILLLRAYLNRFMFSKDQKSLFIQVGGMVAFLAVRSVAESTGAFFGVDWLLLGPILLYLQAINFRSVMQPQVASKRRLWDLTS